MKIPTRYISLDQSGNEEYLFGESKASGMPTASQRSSHFAKALLCRCARNIFGTWAWMNVKPEKVTPRCSEKFELNISFYELKRLSW